MRIREHVGVPVALQPEQQRCILWKIDPQATLVGPYALFQSWLSRYLPLVLIKLMQRRRRSKLVFYGGPLNTGWRVKSVVKIINGPSIHCALSPDRQLQWGAFVEPATTMCNDISIPLSIHRSLGYHFETL